MSDRPRVIDSRRGRPLVAVSSCLLGEAVRYDGGHKYESAVARDLGGIFELVPVCPELEAGMGVPREPVRLEDDPLDTASAKADLPLPRMIGVDTGRDWTAPMRALAERRARELAALGIDGWVFKARSPSCGLRDVPVYGAWSDAVATGRGLFALLIAQALPDLPMADEDEVRDEAGRARFVEVVQARHARRSGG